MSAVEGHVVPDAIELQPFYHDVKNTIVRPKQIVVGTRYFWERWAPRLGPTLTVLIVRLRMHCYYNQSTQERRDWCFPTQQTLAEEVGVSRWTVMRELNMDDPLVEEDRGRAAALLAAGPLLEQAEGRNDAYCGISDPGRQVAERPFTGKAAKALVTDLSQKSVQSATGPTSSKLPPEEKPEEISVDAAVVARELIQENMSGGVAYRLARQYPSEVIRDKMALVRTLKEQQELRNVPGFLRRAIEQDYQAPLAATGTEGSGAQPLLELRKPLSLPPPRYPFTTTDGGSSRSVDVWHIAKQVLAADMRPAAFNQWLQPSKLLHYELGQACVIVPDVRVQRYIEQRLRPAIEAALKVACGGPTSLEIVVEGEDPNA